MHLGRRPWQVACNTIFWVVVVIFLFVLVSSPALLSLLRRCLLAGCAPHACWLSSCVAQ